MRIEIFILHQFFPGLAVPMVESTSVVEVVHRLAVEVVRQAGLWSTRTVAASTMDSEERVGV